MPDSQTIRSGAAQARIGARGAELLSLTFGGRELIWPGDPALWPRQAPVLFPFCGWLAGSTFRVGDKSYRTTVHGFGPDAEFAIARLAEDRLRLTLTDTAQTRALFPFAFTLEITIGLTADALHYGFEIRNPGAGVLPYALGFHPGFRWPFAAGTRQDYRLVFEHEETGMSPVIAQGGLFTDQRRKPPLKGREFDVMAALADADATAVLDSSNRTVSFVAPDGSAIRVSMDNIAHWMFWSLPPAPYLCIEGWTGQGDPVGFEGDIFDKPGMIHLPPGGQARHAFEIGYRPGGAS